MPINVASAYLTDEEFLSDFESCRLDPVHFRHGDHLRLAWLYLHRYTPEIAEEKVRAGILRFAAHHDALPIYNETVTTAWVRLIATHNECSFDEFLSCNAARLTADLLQRFWSPEVLAGDQAKAEWVAPDREPLPSV